MLNPSNDPDFSNKKPVFLTLLPNAIHSTLEESGRYTIGCVNRENPHIVSILIQSELCLRTLPAYFNIEVLDGKLTGTTPKGDLYDIVM